MLTMPVEDVEAVDHHLQYLQKVQLERRKRGSTRYKHRAARLVQEASFAGVLCA